MKNLNNRSTSSPSLRGVSITTKQSTAHSAVIPECLCRESVVRRSGFTLVELVIVIAIVIILSVVSVPIYRGYTRNAKMSEGYALLGLILSAQKAYYSQYGNFLATWNSVHQTSYDPTLGIDARGNKYFTKFSIGTWVEEGALKYELYSLAFIPEELRGSRSILQLYFNVTKTEGAKFSERNWE